MKRWRKRRGLRWQTYGQGREGGESRQRWCGAASGPWKGARRPADIVSTPLTSKARDYGESEGLQTMGGEENNIKVSRTFESG